MPFNEIYSDYISVIWVWSLQNKTDTNNRKIRDEIHYIIIIIKSRSKIIFIIIKWCKMLTCITNTDRQCYHSALCNGKYKSADLSNGFYRIMVLLFKAHLTLVQWVGNYVYKVWGYCRVYTNKPWTYERKPPKNKQTKAKRPLEKIIQATHVFLLIKQGMLWERERKQQQ